MSHIPVRRFAWIPRRGDGRWEWLCWTLADRVPSPDDETRTVRVFAWIPMRIEGHWCWFVPYDADQVRDAGEMWTTAHWWTIARRRVR